ncbi:MAG: putative sulfate exporter family transporter [Phycisphaeraceae bacterium]|nr:MAG: putative sulfate exporter family transporter [Phycisphaeraceae bacterium]
MPDASTGTSPAKPAVFIIAAALCLTPWVSPPIALALGAALALAGLAAFEKKSRAVSRQLIQWCVAALGLLIPMDRLAGVVAEGFAIAAGTILVTFALGFGVGALLRVGRERVMLIASGTAICGGSAIAAVGASIGAASADMAIATGSIFLLNAAALYIFPMIGHALELTDAQFGAWAGVAIHDVSSVTGAASVYVASEGGVPGAALATATVVKLSRVVWIVPIALACGWWCRRRGGDGTPGRAGAVPVPWLIVLFIAASVAAWLVPGVARHADEIRAVAKQGFSLALFLIGSGLSIGALRKVGWRSLVLAVALWVVVSAASLAVVRATVE